jgi:glycosyltransferase involved in cell wall biosynthesis
MIVKNEARIIRRCLDAARFVVDYVSICDTGSTDKTVQVVEDWLSTNKVPGKVHTAEWKNFGHNRSIALEQAHTSFPQASYLLLIDADMVLVNKGFAKDALTQDGYMVTQTEQGSTYRNLRIVKNSFLWKSVGVTHEYTSPFSSSTQTKIEMLDTLWIDDRSDGGSKDDKLDRDALLLIQGLKDEPENSRYMFYLANTYFAMNQCLDAVYWYEQRIADKKNGFEEEAWYAMYRIAQCYEKMKDYPRTVYWYMKAINRRPHRIEPYVCLAKHYIFSDPPHNYYNATWIIKKGIAHARRTTDLLFVEDKAYDYECWYCLALASHYVELPLEGYAACQKVMESVAPESLKKHVKQIKDTFYTPAISQRL